MQRLWSKLKRAYGPEVSLAIAIACLLCVPLNVQFQAPVGYIFGPLLVIAAMLVRYVRTRRSHQLID